MRSLNEVIIAKSSVYERLFFVSSIIVVLYFLFSTFGFLGEVKDRYNYERTFENMNEHEGYLGLFFGSSVFHGLIYNFGFSSNILSIYSLVFLGLKILLIRKIFKSWAYVFLYLIKFAFIIDMILLKESLALLCVLAAIVCVNSIGRYFYLIIAFFTHISVISLFLLAFKKINNIILIPIFLMFGGVIVLYITPNIENIPYAHYFVSKLDAYRLDSQIGGSFLITNPIFWTGVMLIIYSIYHRKYNYNILFTQIFGVLMGFMHPIYGAPAFRFWQISSFADMFGLRQFGSRVVLIFYILPNFLLFLYGPVYLRNFLNT